jgi:hypothetical protein
MKIFQFKSYIASTGWMILSMNAYIKGMRMKVVVYYFQNPEIS